LFCSLTNSSGQGATERMIYLVLFKTAQLQYMTAQNDTTSPASTMGTRGCKAFGNDVIR